MVYCGTNKKALASQKQLAQALYDLMREKAYAEIGVSEICRRAGVSRQTFYSLYQSKENIIVEYLQTNAYAPGGPAGSGADDAFRLEDFCLRFSRYLTENGEILALLARNGILYLLSQSMEQAMLACPFFLEHLADDERQYIAAFIANGFTGIAQAYVARGLADSEEYLRGKIGFLFRGGYLPTDGAGN